jgi:CheY-like chemotaxis protein
MDFATSGTAALEKLEGWHADVVLSDMRMPEMDGATLLANVQRHYPDTLRIALSGHAGMEQLARTLPIAHQYLSKPCEPAVLRSTVARACGISVRFRRHVSRGHLEGLGTPRPLSLYRELSELLRRPEPSTDNIIHLIERDANPTHHIVELLGLCCSKLADLRSAFRRCGVPAIRNLVLAFDALAAYSTTPAPHWISVEHLYRRSLAAAYIAATLVDGEEEKSQALVAGLLHDIGWVHLAFEQPSRGRKIADLIADGETSRSAAETQVLGIRSQDVGGYLLARMGLALPVVEAVVYCHQPDQAAQPAPRLVSALHVAVAIAQRVDSGDQGATTLALNGDLLAQFGGSERLTVLEAEASALFRVAQPQR